MIFGSKNNKTPNNILDKYYDICHKAKCAFLDFNKSLD